MDDLLDIFELQEVPDNESQLKKQYFKLSKKWHPDKNPNNLKEANERFKQIGDAYEKLKNIVNGSCNVKKRKFSDTFSNNAASASASTSASKKAAKNAKKYFFDPHVDPNNSNNCTYNLNAYVNVTLEQIFTGTSVNVKIKRQEVCTKCSKGNYYKFYTCSVCRSDRVYYKEVEFQVNIPRSTKNGYKIVFPKESHRSLVAQPGDLNVFVKITKHPIFSLKDGGGVHLKMKRTISVHETISKRKFTIRTIDKRKYYIKKPQYQTFMPNTCIKIKNAGLYDPERDKRGHLYVYFDIKDYDKMRKDQKLGWFEASECLLRKKSKSEEYFVKKNIRIVLVK